MSAILHAVWRLARAPGRDHAGLAAELTDVLAAEPRLAMRTRLGLVELASRIETGTAGGRALCGDSLPAVLQAAEAVNVGDDAQALEALIACAPALRAAASALVQRSDPFALVPRALLDLLAGRLH